jgi:hypothetical protein
MCTLNRDNPVAPYAGMPTSRNAAWNRSRLSMYRGCVVSASSHRETVAMFRKEAGMPPEGIFSRPPEGEAYRLLAE